MAGVRAAVLAAGRGIRMGGKEPKTLLPLEGGQPMLHYILSGLRVAGVDDILVVTGFHPDAVQEFIAQNFGDLNVTYVFNARWASWGNFHSVRVAIDQSPGSNLLVVNSDVVIHPSAYRRVAEMPGDLVLATQKRLVLDEEDMRVRLQGDRILDIGKGLQRAWSHAEYAGVSLLRPLAASLYLKEATDLEWGQRKDLYYEDIYARIIPNVDARAVTVGEDEYAEVDVPADVPKAAAVVARHEDAWSQSMAVAP